MNMKSKPQTRQNGITPQKSCFWPPLEREPLLTGDQQELIWKKYCGFLEFSISEYDSIQKLLLKEQIELVMRSLVGQKIIGDTKPESIEEFRRCVPLTTYADYCDLLTAESLTAHHQKPLFWVENAEAGSQPKSIPVNLNMLQSLADDVITAFLLSSGHFKGDVRLKPSDQMLIGFGQKTISEAVSIAIGQRLGCHNINDPCLTHQLEPFCLDPQAIEKSLKTGIDYILASSESIIRLGENVGFKAIKKLGIGLNLTMIMRLIKSWLIEHLQHRPSLAKDIWQVKGLICCHDRDMRYRERIERIWGIRPTEVYYAPETGFMAFQCWNKKALTFLPYRNYYEFIPLKELAKEATQDGYQPATVLMHEIQAGEVYELVASNFHGGPFLRYRLGDFLKVTALADPETRVALPQFTLYPKPV